MRDGAPPCGIYLKIKQSGKSFTLIETLKQICLGLNSSEYEKNMHVFEYSGNINEDNKDYITALKEFLQYNGMVFIVRENIEFAHEIKADGVIVKTFEEAKTAREKLGSNAIIGIRLTASRKKVEQAIESDVDYISLPLNLKTEKTALKLLRIWAMVTDKPCLVEGNLNNNHCRALVESGASFIDASNYVFKYPKGVLQAIVNMLYAIEISKPSGTLH